TRPPIATADAEAHGFNALYRLYPAGQAWVFLAAPSQREWSRLVQALPGANWLASDPRFATAESRTEHDGALAAALGAIFRTRDAATWERELRAADVACVAAGHGPTEAHYIDEGSVGRLHGYVTTANHPILDEVPRLAPLIRFSRSGTVAGDAGLVGQHTAEVLKDFGYSEEE